METKNIICTCCPMGCHMQVTLKNGKVTSVVGNTCKKGAIYAESEVTNPKRTLTTTVKTDTISMLSVKSREAIPFSKLSKAMKELSEITVKTPVRIGDVVLADICSTGVDIIATKNIS